MEAGQQQAPLNLPDFLHERNVWGSQDKIVMTGKDFESITNLLGIFRAGIAAIDATVHANKVSGVIKTEFFDENGNAVSLDVVNRIYEAISQQAAQGIPQEVTSKPLNPELDPLNQKPYQPPVQAPVVPQPEVVALPTPQVQP